MLGRFLAILSATVLGALALGPRAQPSCPGYKAVNIRGSDDSFSVDLKLAGEPCNTYGTDLKDLVLSVEYQTGGHKKTARLFLFFSFPFFFLFFFPLLLTFEPQITDCTSLSMIEMRWFIRFRNRWFLGPVVMDLRKLLC